MTCFLFKIRALLCSSGFQTGNFYDSTVLTGGCCKKLSREELLDILNECK